MAHHNTILSQIVALFPRHEFESLAKAHHVGQKFRSFNRWSQFLAMMVAQLSGRKSLRDLAANLQAQGRRFYHLGLRATSRATLARVNECQPHELYKDLFFSLLKLIFYSYKKLIVQIRTHRSSAKSLGTTRCISERLAITHPGCSAA